MAENLHLMRPWLVAAWPGMGHVGLNAGIYLMAKLEMSLISALEAEDLFDVDFVEVKEGLIQPTRRPRSHYFVWRDPKRLHDLVVFLGEAQPPMGKYAFCRQVIEFAKQLGVERVFTFASMATQMHPEHGSSVYGAATDRESLEELKRLELKLLEGGHISGLNGVLLAAAAEAGLRGACLMGEMPHIFRQLPFPRGSLAILEVFTTITGIELDFSELETQSKAMEKQLGEILAQVEEKYGQQFAPEEDENAIPAPPEEEGLTSAQRQQIESLFEQAGRERSKAFELKQELDRLQIFKEYEDRFLDLFKKAGE